MTKKAQKPRPKSELLVRSDPAFPHMPTIHVYSEDARQWIEEEAPDYGELRQSDVSDHRYYLYINELRLPAPVSQSLMIKV